MRTFTCRALVHVNKIHVDNTSYIHVNTTLGLELGFTYTRLVAGLQHSHLACASCTQVVLVTSESIHNLSHFIEELTPPEIFMETESEPHLKK